MDEEEQKRLKQLLDNLYLSEKVSIHSSGFGFGLTISNTLAKKIHSSREDDQVCFDDEFLPGIHFTSIKNVGSEFRFYLNIQDSENIVAQSISNETQGKLSRIKVIFQQFFCQDSKQIFFKNSNKVKDYEYFELDDDKEIFEKETNDTEKNMKMIEHLSEFNATQSIQKSNIRTLSRKITHKFEKSHNFKTIDKSKFFGSSVHGKLITSSQNYNFKELTKSQQKNLFSQKGLGLGQLGQQHAGGKLLPERKTQKKYTHSFLINQFLQKKSETLIQIDNDFEEDVKVGFIPNNLLKNEEEPQSLNNLQNIQKTVEEKPQLKAQPNSNVFEVPNTPQTFNKQTSLYHIQKAVEEKPQLKVQQNSINSNVFEVPNNCKILIVDDEMMNIFGLKMILKILGVDQNNILQAGNGEEAVNIFNQHLDDKSSYIKLIIMDVNMPVMDGVEATKQIKEIINQLRLQGQEINETNIVACSSYDDYETKLQCLKAGMVSYLSKPCNKDSLSHIIQKYYFSEKQQKK